MCRNNGPGSLTKINKSTTKGDIVTNFLILRPLLSQSGPARVHNHDCGTNFEHVKIVVCAF